MVQQKKHILLVEDDPHIGQLLQIHLKDMDCRLTIIADGAIGLEHALNNTYDLLLLDLTLPNVDGLEICRQVRAKNIMTPILMLTARSEEIDKVLGLELGADDYITKPFSIRELLARIKAIFRRKVYWSKQISDKEEQHLFHYQDLILDIEKRKVSINGTRIDLSPKEFDLLSLLATHPGKSYNRTQLLNLVWGYDFEGFEHTVNSHINRLRAKIEPNMERPQYILTTWGVGYRFNEDLYQS